MKIRSFLSLVLILFGPQNSFASFFLEGVYTPEVPNQLIKNIQIYSKASSKYDDGSNHMIVQLNYRTGSKLFEFSSDFKTLYHTGICGDETDKPLSPEFIEQQLNSGGGYTYTFRCGGEFSHLNFTYRVGFNVNGRLLEFSILEKMARATGMGFTYIPTPGFQKILNNENLKDLNYTTFKKFEENVNCKKMTSGDFH